MGLATFRLQMGYRDEMEALRAANAKLEAELAEARHELGRVPAPTTDEPNVWLGAPTRLVREITVDGEVGDEGLELLTSELRREFGEMGRSENIGRTFAWATSVAPNGRIIEVSCERRAGKTTVRIQEPLRTHIGAVFGGGVGGLGGGGMSFVIPIAVHVPALLPVVIVSWLALCYLLMRVVYRRTVRKRSVQLDGLSRRIERVMASEASRRIATPLRVVDIRGDLPDAEGELAAEEQASAELGRNVGVRSVMLGG